MRTGGTVEWLSISLVERTLGLGDGYLFLNCLKNALIANQELTLKLVNDAT